MVDTVVLRLTRDDGSPLLIPFHAIESVQAGVGKHKDLTVVAMVSGHDEAYWTVRESLDEIAAQIAGPHRAGEFDLRPGLTDALSFCAVEARDCGCADRIADAIQAEIRKLENVDG